MSRDPSTFCRILYGNRLAEAGVSISAGLGSWTGLADLADSRIIGRPARVTYAGGASEVVSFVVHLGQRCLIPALWLEHFAVRLTVTSFGSLRAARLRLTTAADVAFTTDVNRSAPGDGHGLYDIDADGWFDWLPIVHDFAALPWEATNKWDLRPTEAELDAYGRRVIFLPAVAWSGEYLKVEIMPMAAAAGTCDLGYLMLPGLFTPDHNYSYGATQGGSFRDLIDTAASGHRVVQPRRVMRSHKVPWKALSKASAFGVYDVAMTQTRAGPLAVLPTLADPHNLPREAFLAQFAATMPALNTITSLYRSTGIELEEIIA